MSAFDFDSAQLPAATPLQHSFGNGQIEAELKSLFLDLFARVSPQTFDVSVLGAPHLGTFELVRRMVNHDGLVLFPGAGEEAATRYLYRAWRSGDLQKRGLHFLRTYLQMLLPNRCTVTQLWHSLDEPYPGGLVAQGRKRTWWLHRVGEPGLRLDGRWGIGRPIADGGLLAERSAQAPEFSGLWLTSRIEIAIEAGEESRSVSRLLPIIRAVIPARLVPLFVILIGVSLAVRARTCAAFAVEKSIRLRYPWRGRVIGDSPAVRWKLGRDADPVRLPEPFGTFRVGERRGGKLGGPLRGERFSLVMDIEKTVDIAVGRGPVISASPAVRWALGLDGLPGGQRLSGGRRPRFSVEFIADSAETIITEGGLALITEAGEVLALDLPAVGALRTEAADELITEAGDPLALEL